MTLELSHLIFIAIGAPALIAAILMLAGHDLKARSAWLALGAPLISLWALLKIATLTSWGSANNSVAFPWVPVLNLDFAFRADGLALFFALLVAGMGVMIILYAAAYFEKSSRNLGHFYAFLLLFMSAMLGTVLSDDLMLLLCFWEITGIASFLLIGFEAGHRNESAQGAKTALLVTLGTGLGLLAACLLLQMHLGTSNISRLKELAPSIASSGNIGTVICGLLLLAAFGKSAQAPFQFWLPSAMAAPTPVSAYLHSATMVKLGVFLIARLHPVFSETPLWQLLLCSVGAVSFLIGTVSALKVSDLKAVLAFSTVAQLGLLMCWFGMASPAEPGLLALGMFQVLSHALYKGSLFMVAGVVQHESGTRDLRQLGGLSEKLPLAGLACLLSAAAMAGIPGTAGFISKEMFLDSALLNLHNGDAGSSLLLTVFVAGSAAMSAVAFRIYLKVFRGNGAPSQGHAAGKAMQLPPLLLALCSLALGLAPALAWPLISRLGVATPDTQTPALWHGFSTGLLLSAGILAAAVWTYRRMDRPDAMAGLPGWLDFQKGFDALLKAISRVAAASSTLLRVHRPVDFLPITIGFSSTLLGLACWKLLPPMNGMSSAPLGLLQAMILLLLSGSAVSVVLLEKWTTRLIALSSTGFLVCFWFMLQRAPDLALTQMLIESATLMLMLLLLGRFPQDAEKDEIKDRGFNLRKGVTAGIALMTGLAVYFIVMHVTSRPHPQPMGVDFIKDTVPLALGSNAVNTVLVDFRGFDTMFEITVLCIAALGCLGLLMRWKGKSQ